jgi:polysaccharide biosynthesis/export protein
MKLRFAFLFPVFLLLFVPLAFAVSLETISLDAAGNSCTVTLRSDGNLNSSGVFVDNPPRVVLDFPGVKSKLPPTYEPRANAYVDKIRTSSFEKAGLKEKGTRVVIDLKTTLNFSVSPIERGIALTLIPPKQTPAIAPSASSSDQKKIDSLDIVIGAEDLLEINVFELPQFSGPTRVAGDGTITMPLIGSIQVQGLTKREIEKKIESSLAAKYVNNPSVSVTIKEYKSRQVSILGAVNNPGAYTIISSRNLLQLLSEAGGLSAGAGTKCFIFRQGATRIEIDLKDLMDNGNPALNVPILPGDVINIPAESKVTIYVLGAVRNPGAVEMSSSMPITLLAAIARAGGPTDQANKSGIQIRRHDTEGNEKVIKANLKDILSGKSPDVELLAGDVINVPESFF